MEMTFLPIRHPHEILNKRSGQRLVKRINDWLFKVFRKTNLGLKAKLDPQKDPYGPNTTYVVEVVPYQYWQTAWMNKTDVSHALFVKGIDMVITGMRERFKLAPSVVRRKGNTDYHSPQGGGHVHMAADIWGFTTDWYRNMERFHRDLATDYANRPYARWLLAHWIGDGGSRVMFNRDRLALMESDNVNWAIKPETVFHTALFRASAIEGRFMASQKASYLTFEFRIVGMVENARQLCAAVRLLKAWMDHIKARQQYGRYSPLRFSLTTAKWDSYTKEEGARAACQAWVKELGLDWEDYEEDFFQRNLLMRINHGAFI